MKKFQIVMALFVLAGFQSVARSADADIKKLIVGKWEAVKVDENTLPKGTLLEFTAEGKLTVNVKKEGKDETINGSYTVDGQTFTYKVKIGDMEFSQKISVKKISDTEMDTVSPENKSVSFKRVK